MAGDSASIRHASPGRWSPEWSEPCRAQQQGHTLAQPAARQGVCHAWRRLCHGAVAAPQGVGRSFHQVQPG